MEKFNCEIINLQYPVESEPLSKVPKSMSQKIKTIRGIDLKDDFLGVAKLIDKCDLIVTIDNTIAHMASALGKDTIVLLPAAPPNFRWLAKGSNTPWYPKTTKLLRKAKIGDWSNVIEELHDEIKQLMRRKV